MTQSLSAMLAAEFGVDFENIHTSLPHHPTENYTRRALTDIAYVVLHHTEAPSLVTWQAVAAYHVKSNGWSGIGYHIGIRDHAGRCMVSLLNLPETRSYHAHAVGNNRGLAVCVAGKKDTEPVTPRELDALTRAVTVIRRWATWREWLPVVGHGDVPGNDTTCPGRYLKEVIPQLNERMIDDQNLEEEIWRVAKHNQVLSPNPTSAIEIMMREQGYTPIGNEQNVLLGGVWQGVAQLGYYPEGGGEVAFFATNLTPTGEWAACMVEQS